MLQVLFCFIYFYQTTTFKVLGHFGLQLSGLKDLQLFVSIYRFSGLFHGTDYIILIFIPSLLTEFYFGGIPLCLQIFKNQKRIIRIIRGLRSRDSCRQVLKNLKHFAITFLIHILLLFVVNKVDLYHTVSHIHGINTMYNWFIFATILFNVVSKRGLLFWCQT
jgi:hypothetical protein